MKCVRCGSELGERPYCGACGAARPETVKPAERAPGGKPGASQLAIDFGDSAEADLPTTLQPAARRPSPGGHEPDWVETLGLGPTATPVAPRREDAAPVAVGRIQPTAWRPQESAPGEDTGGTPSVRVTAWSATDEAPSDQFARPAKAPAPPPLISALAEGAEGRRAGVPLWARDDAPDPATPTPSTIPPTSSSTAEPAAEAATTPAQRWSLPRQGPVPVPMPRSLAPATGDAPSPVAHDVAVAPAAPPAQTPAVPASASEPLPEAPSTVASPAAPPSSAAPTSAPSSQEAPPIQDAPTAAAAEPTVPDIPASVIVAPIAAAAAVAATQSVTAPEKAMHSAGPAPATKVPTPPSAPATPARPAAPRPAPVAHAGDVVRVRMGGFWRRGLASIVDLGLISAIVYVVLKVGVGSLSLAALPPRKLFLPDYIVSLMMDQPGKIFPLILFALGTAFAYFLLFQAIFAWTPGKRLLGMRIVDGRGQRIGPIRALLRTFGYGISTAFFFMGFLWAAFDLERRAIHDVLCGTYVIVGDPESKAAPVIKQSAEPRPKPPGGRSGDARAA